MKPSVVYLIPMVEDTSIEELNSLIEKSEGGDAESQNELGVIYRDEKKEYCRAAELFSKAAYQGHADAQNNLGYAYENGEGVNKSLEEAVKWYRAAADQGYDLAQYNLGRMYYCGNGVQESNEEAFKLFMLSAEQNYSPAQNYLGIMYEYGYAVSKSCEEAARWYRAAAEQGECYAQHNLAILYKTGNGVEQSDVEAAKLYKASAENGNENAQYDLGTLYFTGRGIEQSYSESARWFKQAMENGIEKAKLMYNVAAKKAHLREIYVIDTETTGTNGYPSDLVLDIGIVKVNLDDYTVEEVYSSIVGYDTTNWSYTLKNSWIFQNSDLKLDDVQNAPSVETVCGEVREILKEKIITSYNVRFDFDEFLNHPPWSFKDLGVTMASDIMLAADKIKEIPRKCNYNGRPAWPKLDAAYEILCPDDPAEINGKQDHRALSDAKMAAHVMLRLSDNGAFSI